MDKRRMCPNCRAFITTDDKICPYCDMKLGPKAIERRSPGDLLGGLIPHARFTTSVILLINVGLYIAMMLHNQGPEGASFSGLNGQTLFDFGAKWAPAIHGGQWWRLITAGFLHGGLLHIGMNSLALYSVGADAEENYGTARYLVIYLAASFCGFYASYLWSPGALSTGASAAIFGLFGAMIALGLRDRSAYGAAIRSHYTQWAIFGLVMAFGISNIDNAAHIGGGAGGFAVAYLAGTPGHKNSVEQIWKVLAAAALLIAIYAFTMMFRWLLLSAAR